jgi:3-methylfumaryl-CoA hydratase
MSGESYAAWIGRVEMVQDVAHQGPLDGLAALLDHAVPPWRAGEIPPLAHWLYFLRHPRQSEIDLDGHPRRGGFLPPIDLPRRMWAGSRVVFHKPIAIGAPMPRRSTIEKVSEKSGASGHMVFVTVRHEIASGDGVAIIEEQDIVFRESPKRVDGAATLESAPRIPDHALDYVPDATALFRFSALTFNAHRIHYDRDYARDVEGYPGLVVQGPFTATLLMDFFLRLAPQTRVSGFSFRAKRPLYEGDVMRLCLARRGARVELWALDAAGHEAMAAELTTGELP